MRANKGRCILGNVVHDLLDITWDKKRVKQLVNCDFCGFGCCLHFRVMGQCTNSKMHLQIVNRTETIVVTLSHSVLAGMRYCILLHSFSKFTIFLLVLYKTCLWCYALY